MFVAVKHFCPSLIFVNNAGVYSSEAIGSRLLLSLDNSVVWPEISDEGERVLNFVKQPSLCWGNYKLIKVLLCWIFVRKKEKSLA